MKAVEWVAAGAHDKSRAVKFTIGEVVGLALAEKASNEIDASFEGKAVEIGFNARYVSEMLGALDEPNVHIAFGDNGPP